MCTSYRYYPEREIGKQLAFSPNNAIFKNLTDQVNKHLQLTYGAIGFGDNDQMESAMIANKRLLAGINFHHPPVRMNFDIIHLQLIRKKEKEYRNKWKTKH